MPYDSETQEKNDAWCLPRPKNDRYKGGMPLHCEKWLFDLSRDILGKENIKILNLFSGTCKKGLRVDLNDEVNPDYIYDAHKVSDLFEKDSFDVILADPPYSNEECEELYGKDYPKLRYNEWTDECDKILKPGGLLIVYHKYIMPNPNPEKYKVVKRIFIGSRTYHLPRVAIYFRKGHWCLLEI